MSLPSHALTVSTLLLGKTYNFLTFSLPVIKPKTNFLTFFSVKDNFMTEYIIFPLEMATRAGYPNPNPKAYSSSYYFPPSLHNMLIGDLLLSFLIFFSI